MASECQICYEKAVKYTIQCGSTTPHQICFDCEREMRLKTKPTLHGRVLICPFCRGEEKEPGLRSRSSYEAELKLLYQELYTRRSRAQLVPRPHAPPARAPPPPPPRAPRAPPPRPPRAPRAPVRPPSPPYVPDSDEEEIPIAQLLRDMGRGPARPAPAPRMRGWCKNRGNTCLTQNRTVLKCAYPAGCSEFVCRSCKMCVGHFQQVPSSPREIWD
jgi:hypothetical protein